MTEFDKVGKQTAEEITEGLLIEVVKKISFEDGDILVVRVKDDQIFDQFYSVLNEMHQDKRVMIINEDQIDILREVSEEEMNKLGWVRVAE